MLLVMQNIVMDINNVMCNWLDLETLGCHLVIPKILFSHYTHMLYYMVMKSINMDWKSLIVVDHKTIY